jgi:hypothetical protein
LFREYIHLVGDFKVSQIYLAKYVKMIPQRLLRPEISSKYRSYLEEESPTKSHQDSMKEDEVDERLSVGPAIGGDLRFVGAGGVTSEKP